MESIDILYERLVALTACAESQNLTGRAKIVSVAFGISTPTPQYLSNLYDACINSVAALKERVANADEADGLTEPDVGATAASQLCATCTAAALHYLPQQDGRIVQQFLDSFFLPLLARSDSLPDRACRLQACSGLAALLVAGRHWDLVGRTAHVACDALDIAATGGPGSSAAGLSHHRHQQQQQCRLGLPVACALLAAVVSQCGGLVGGRMGPESEEAAAVAALDLLEGVLPRLRGALRPMLCSNAVAVRQAALKAMLPTTLTCARECGPALLAATTQDIWQLALDLLAGSATATSTPAGARASDAAAVPASGTGAAPGGAVSAPLGASQRTALALLAASCGPLLDPASGVDVRGCGRFWELMRMCLSLPADVDALERKRALLLLQRLAPQDQMDSPGWALWTALYDVLDEFPIHLVAPMWGKIDQLHAPAPEYCTEAVVPKSYIPRKKELKQRKATATADAPDGDGSASTPTAAAPTTAFASVSMEWQCVLWARALQHGNIQVQRLALRTLLQRDWREPEVRRGVPVGFAAGVLLPALTRDHHYRGGGAEAEAMNVQAAAASWLHGWFSSAPLDHRLDGLLAVRTVVVGSDLSRLGLQQLMRGLAAGARGAAADGTLQEAVSASASSSAASFPSALLAALRSVLVYLSNFTGLPYKRSVWRSVLAIAAAAVPAAAAGLGPCLRLLQEIPPAALEPGGELRGIARDWLLGRPLSDIPQDAAAYPSPSETSPATGPLTASETATVVSWLKSMLEEYWDSRGRESTGSETASTGAGGSTTTSSVVTEEKLGSYFVSAGALTQLLLLFDDVDAACSVVLRRLQRSLYGMYDRPYLQAHEVDRALELLRELLTAVPPLPSGAPPAAPPPLPAALVALLAGCADDLTGAASTAADAFLEDCPPAATTAVTAGGLPRAACAWSVVALALLRTSRSPEEVAGAAARKFGGAAVALLGRLCRAPLPAGRHPAVVAGMRAATQAAEALRQAASWSPAIRDLARERLDPSALASAALRDAAAAGAAAATAAAAANNTATGAPDLSAVLGEIEAAKWPLLDAATAYAVDLAPFKASAAAGAGAAAGTGLAAKAAGGLQPGVVSEVLAQSVAALSEYPEGQVLPLLRCLRRCWGAVAAEGAEAEAQIAAARALGADLPQDTFTSSGSSPPAAALLEAVCWPVVQALWNALCATPRRTGPLCAAFVNTALMPSLYVRQAGPSLTALHGPSGPCRWLLSRLLDWGGTSSRFLLLLACQLGAFLPAQPDLVECYGREIQLLLLWGSRKGSTYDPDGGGGEGPEAEELAAVAPPPDPSLVSSPAIHTEVAPRVALLCCLHNLAEQAGCVWPPPAAAGSTAAGSTLAAAEPLGGQTAAAAAKPVAPPVPKRPVIIFGESSYWDEQSTAAPPANGVSVNNNNGITTATTTAATTTTTSSKGGAAEPSRRQEAGAGVAEGAVEGGELPDYGAPPPADPHHPALRAGLGLWRRLLEVALTDPLLCTDKVRNGSELHRQKVRLWQSLVVLSSFVPRTECGPAVAAMMGQLNGNNPPTVKQYTEAVVAALTMREPSLLRSHLLPLLTNYGRHQTGLGSYILITAQVVLHSPPAVQAAHLRPLLTSLSPWLTCHGHNVRTYAQLVTWALLERFPPDHPTWQHSIGDLGYLRQMQAFMGTNVDLVRLRKNIGDPILQWSPAGLAHPTRVFSSAPEGVCLAGSPIEQATFEGAPPTLVDRMQSFLVAERHRLRGELADRDVEREFAPQERGATGGGPAAAAGGEEAPRGGGGGGAGAGSQRGPAGGGPGESGGVGDFQRKITPEALLATLEGPGGAGVGAGAGAADGEAGGVLAALMEGEEEEAAAGQDWKSSRRPRHDVLLVASLIDKLPNLAGLARTCEVLGAGRLVLADLAATREPGFTAVSVTAEQWLPMEEVKPAALLAWLERRAAEGYTLVGLEQTSESVRLPDYRWPARVVLVLGREKEGIPPELLGCLDATLEIPQVGIIRSLNVHVTGAIALYEYVRQMGGRR